MAQRKSNGAAIRALREALGLTQEQAARAACMDQSHWSNIESGRKNAGPAVCRRIADALGVPLAAISSAADPEPAGLKSA